MKRFCGILVFLVSSALIASEALSQDKVCIGASGIYNFQTKGLGLGFRVQIRVANKVHAVPQVYYFFPFNTVHEMYGGMNVHYDALKLDKLTIYGLAGGALNMWFNAEESNYEKAKNTNVAVEAGVGMQYGNGCWKPFAEQRYNVVWQEGCFRIGVIWCPGCTSEKGGGKKKGGKGGGKNKDELCPAYW